MNSEKDEKFALCVDNKDRDDLEKRKIYRIIRDEVAEKDGYLRIVDESGEDYLYPDSCFIAVDLPIKAQEAILLAG